jgi:hypothetical protein
LKAYVDKLITDNAALPDDDITKWTKFPKNSLIALISNVKYYPAYISSHGYVCVDMVKSISANASDNASDNTTRHQCMFYKEPINGAVAYDSLESLAKLCPPWCWNREVIDIPPFTVHYTELLGYDELTDAQKATIKLWYAPNGFQYILHGSTHYHTNEVLRVAITPDELAIIAPYINLDSSYSFYNEEFCVVNTAWEFASFAQVNVMIHADIRGVMDVSIQNNKQLYNAMRVNDIELMDAIIKHPKFDYSRCDRYGNGCTDCNKDTPLFKWFTSNAHTTPLAYENIITTTLEYKIKFMFDNLYVMLNPDDKKLAIAEAFWAAKYTNDTEMVDLLLANLMQVLKD